MMPVRQRCYVAPYPVQPPSCLGHISTMAMATCTFFFTHLVFASVR